MNTNAFAALVTGTGTQLANSADAIGQTFASFVAWLEISGTFWLIVFASLAHVVLGVFS